MRLGDKKKTCHNYQTVDDCLEWKKNGSRSHSPVNEIGNQLRAKKKQTFCKPWRSKGSLT